VGEFGFQEAFPLSLSHHLFFTSLCLDIWIVSLGVTGATFLHLSFVGLQSFSSGFLIGSRMLCIRKMEESEFFVFLAAL